jgi:integrase
VETAHRVLNICSQVMRYAIASGRIANDPTSSLRDALATPKVRHFAAVTDPKRLGELLTMMDGYAGTLQVRAALRLAPLLFVRPGELRKARWADISFEKAEWAFTSTKMNIPLIVPLATQAIAALKELHPLTGSGVYVFPSARSITRPMSNVAVLAALRRLGIGKEEMCGHGFRASARTIMDEILGIRPEIIEHQLSHTVRDPLGRAYTRTQFLPERRAMMQQWADYLDQIKDQQSNKSTKSNIALLRKRA